MSELKTNKISTNDQNNVAIDNALNLKSYTTAQRDALTSVAGDMIYNSDDSKVQVHNGSAWEDVGAGIEGFQVEYLVVGGGGAGAYRYDDQRAAGAGAKPCGSRGSRPQPRQIGRVAPIPDHGLQHRRALPQPRRHRRRQPIAVAGSPGKGE